jgi:tRNA A-37 threonylcarbamoyl transferase component Bud32
MDDSNRPTERIATYAIPGYQIVELIARGGMGGVYLAEDATLKRMVAIKVINADITDDAELKRRFTGEAMITAGFQHTNIVTVYSSNWIGETQYFVMEYLPGGTLSQRLKAQRMKPDEVYRVARQLADALAYAHRRDVVHRDLKPSNVLMRADGTPVLSDFGIAKALVTDGTQTAMGVVMGSKRYMAPEQAEGKQVSSSADIYSFGLVLYEMLMGELTALHPVRTRDDTRLLGRAMGAVDPEVAQLIARCLELRADQRPTAIECREVLEHAVERLLPASARRRRILAAGLVVLAATAAWALWLSRHDAPKTRIVAHASLVSRQPAAAVVYLDGQPIDGKPVPLEAGSHLLAATAPGYYGIVQALAADPAHPSVPVTIHLAAVTLPSPAEFDRFVRLSENESISAADLQSVTESTLHTALQAQRQQQTDDVEGLDQLMREVSTLRRLSDRRAAVAAMLIDSLRLGKISESRITPALSQASAQGDAMATLFIALATRDSLNRSTSPLMPSDTRMRSYCTELELAAKQGWDSVANDFRRRDSCP